MCCLLTGSGFRPISNQLTEMTSEILSVCCGYFSDCLPSHRPLSLLSSNISIFPAVLGVGGMGGQVLVGGLPGMPAMVQQVPHLGLIGVPRFR